MLGNSTTLDISNDSWSKGEPWDDLRQFTSLEQTCSSLNEDFARLQKKLPDAGPDALPAAAKLLEQLRHFDQKYSLTMLTSSEANNANNASKSEEIKAQVRKTAVRICFLQLMTSARHLVAAAPDEDVNSNSAFGCSP